MPPDDEVTPGCGVEGPPRDPPEDLWIGAMLRWLGTQDPLPPVPPSEDEQRLPLATQADPDWWLAG